MECTSFAHYWEITGLPGIEKGKVIGSADTRSNLGFKTITTSQLLNKPISNFSFSRLKPPFQGLLRIERQRAYKCSKESIVVGIQVSVSSSVKSGQYLLRAAEGLNQTD